VSAVLRAYGDSFDVEAFLEGCSLPVCAVKRKGEPVYPASQPHGRQHEQSGVHVNISDPGFDAFPNQVTEAVTFLQSQFEEVRRLSEWPGVGDITLDFGIERRDTAVQCNVLTAELVRLAGLLGMSIELSLYRGPDEIP
jgi:hypothetical protein